VSQVADMTVHQPMSMRLDTERLVLRPRTDAADR
jgi:hypothetical protein